jgi:hypothetical protein
MDKLEQNYTKLNTIKEFDENQIKFSKLLINTVVKNIEDFGNMLLKSIYLPNGLLNFIINHPLYFQIICNLSMGKL